MDKHYFKGLDSFAEGTCDCDLNGCLYNQDERCIYSIAPIKQETTRACHEDEHMADSDYDYYSFLV